MTEADRPRQCVIIGAGGHGRVVLDILRQAGIAAAGFVDSDPEAHGRIIDGIEVLGPLQILKTLRGEGVNSAIIAIGDNGTRRHFFDHVEAAGLQQINAVHPSANIADTTTLGRGVVIAAGALVGAHCHIGDAAILNTGSIVDHETMISTACHVCPGARLAGRVTVESGAFIGIGATIIQRVRIGHDAVVGAGAVVLEDVAPMATVVGLPAREIKRVKDPDEHNEWLAPQTAKR